MKAINDQRRAHSQAEGGNYACCHWQAIVNEPMVPAIIDPGLASQLVQVVITKFMDHAHLYWQEAICLRYSLQAICTQGIGRRSSP